MTALEILSAIQELHLKLDALAVTDAQSTAALFALADETQRLDWGFAMANHLAIVRSLVVLKRFHLASNRLWFAICEASARDDF